LTGGRGARPAVFDKNVYGRAHVIYYIRYGGRALIKSIFLLCAYIQQKDGKQTYGSRLWAQRVQAE